MRSGISASDATHVCLALWHEGIFSRPAVKGGGRLRTEAPGRPWGLATKQEGPHYEQCPQAAGVGFHVAKWVEASPGAAGFGFLGSFMGPVSEQQVAECFWSMIGKGRKEQRRQVWEWAQGFCLWTCRCPRQMAEGRAPRTPWSEAYSLAGQKIPRVCWHQRAWETC